MKKDNILIITTKNCQPCEKVKEILAGEGYEYEEVPIKGNRKLAEKLRDEGVLGFPVVYKDNKYMGYGLVTALNVDKNIDLSKYIQR